MLDLNFDLHEFKKTYLFERAAFIPQAFTANNTYLKEFYKILLNPLNGAHNDLVRVLNQSEAIAPEIWSHSFPQDNGIYRDISAILKAIELKSSIIFDEYYRYSQDAKELVAFIQQQFNCISACNAYLSQAGGAAYSIHRDCHHVLVFALSGKKRWTVFNKKQVMHHAHHFIEPVDSEEDISNEGVFLDAVMQPGDMLYIPVGQYHCVENLTDNALHLTVSMRFKTLFSILEDALAALLEPEIVTNLSTAARQMLEKVHPLYKSEQPIAEKELIQSTELLCNVIKEVVSSKAFIANQHLVTKNKHLNVFITPTDEFIEEIAECSK